MDAARDTWLPAEPVSAGQARRFVTDALGAWGLTAVADDALLLTTELVTNAVLHAATAAIELRVLRLPDGVRVEVTDTSPVPPRPRHHRASSVGGRGLALVEAYARTWGTEPSLPGKTVWFELGAPAQPVRPSQV